MVSSQILENSLLDEGWGFFMTGWKTSPDSIITFSSHKRQSTITEVRWLETVLTWTRTWPMVSFENSSVIGSSIVPSEDWQPLCTEKLQISQRSGINYFLRVFPVCTETSPIWTPSMVGCCLVGQTIFKIIFDVCLYPCSYWWASLAGPIRSIVWIHSAQVT